MLLNRVIICMVLLIVLVLAGCGGSPSNQKVLPSDNTLKVLVLNFDPIIEIRNNQRLHEVCQWYNPTELVNNFKSDMIDCSHNRLNIQIVEWKDIDEFPLMEDKFQYNDNSYVSIYEEARAARGDWWSYEKWHNCGWKFDYQYYIEKYNLTQRINNKEINEVWILGGHDWGMYESRMADKGAYWCNAPGLNITNCYPFVMMYFNYDRDVDCMLESFGHRTECIMCHIFGRWDYNIPFESMNKWERFTLYDKVAPGKASCGNIHFAPNSTTDYDWGNTQFVESSYIDWQQNYPNLTGQTEIVNCNTWGNGDMRLHHLWWYGCIPHDESIDGNGFLNNWWYYIILIEK